MWLQFYVGGLFYDFTTMQMQIYILSYDNWILTVKLLGIFFVQSLQVFTMQLSANTKLTLNRFSASFFFQLHLSMLCKCRGCHNEKNRRKHRDIRWYCLIFFIWRIFKFLFFVSLRYSVVHSKHSNFNPKRVRTPCILRPRPKCSCTLLKRMFGP